MARTQLSARVSGQGQGPGFPAHRDRSPRQGTWGGRECRGVAFCCIAPRAGTCNAICPRHPAWLHGPVPRAGPCCSKPIQALASLASWPGSSLRGRLTASGRWAVSHLGSLGLSETHPSSWSPPQAGPAFLPHACAVWGDASGGGSSSGWGPWESVPAGELAAGQSGPVCHQSVLVTGHVAQARVTWRRLLLPPAGTSGGPFQPELCMKHTPRSHGFGGAGAEPLETVTGTARTGQSLYWQCRGSASSRHDSGSRVPGCQPHVQSCVGKVCSPVQPAPGCQSRMEPFPGPFPLPCKQVPKTRARSCQQGSAGQVPPNPVGSTELMARLDLRGFQCTCRLELGKAGHPPLAQCLAPEQTPVGTRFCSSPSVTVLGRGGSGSSREHPHPMLAPCTLQATEGPHQPGTRPFAPSSMPREGQSMP